MSLKKYMVIDLIMLGFIGALLEGVGTNTGYFLLAGHTPTTILSLLIMVLAITRWKWWGLILAPVLALGNYIGGLSIDGLEGYNQIFNIQYYISVIIGLLGTSIILVFYKFVGLKKVTTSNLTLIGVGIVVFIVYELVRTATYWIIGGRYLGVLNANLFDLIGLVVLIVGSILIKHQGSLINVKDKLIEDKKEQIARQEAQMKALELDDENIDILINNNDQDSKRS
jgi:hypothetical protein